MSISCRRLRCGYREAVAGAGAYHLALPSPVRSFDPMFAEDSSSVEVCRLIYGRLVDISSAGSGAGMARQESRNDGQVDFLH